jgi:hypothetical protein
MPTKRRSVQTRFWEDPFVEELSPSEKLLFIYLLTNSQTNLIGIYEVSLKRIAYDTGLGKDTIEKAFKRFEKFGKAIYIDNYVILPNFLKNQSLNNNMQRGAIKEWEDVPKWLKVKVLENHSEGLDNDSESFESIQNLILKMKGRENENESEGKGESSHTPNGLSFLSGEGVGDFYNAWMDYLQHRKEMKLKSYASATSEQKALKKLMQMAGNDPEKAQEIVDQSRINQWQGLFPLKDTTEKETNNGRPVLPGN